MVIDTAAIFGWLELLDQLDYYAILDVDRAADSDALKRGFHAFAGKFHPDGHMWRSAEAQEAVEAIFKRGTEAYWVLSNPTLRGHYDAQLSTASPHASPRMPSLPPGTRANPLSDRLEDKARTSTARPFARRAQELVESGDLKQAKLQLVMAAHFDPGNAELEDYLARIDYEIKAKK